MQVFLVSWPEFATAISYEVEFRLRHRSGEYHWQLGRALPVRNEHGEIVRWMGTSTYIHERILMQAALHDTRARLEAALTAAEIGTWTWDIPADRMHADCNLAAMFGIAPEHADDQPIAVYFAALHPDDVGAVRNALGKALTSSEPYHERFRVRAVMMDERVAGPVYKLPPGRKSAGHGRLPLAGGEVPRALQVAYGNCDGTEERCEASAWLLPSLTTSDTPRYRIGYEAASLLLDVIAGGSRASGGLISALPCASGKVTDCLRIFLTFHCEI